MSAYRFIEAEKAAHSVPALCRMLGISRSGYYAWRSRLPSERARFDSVLSEKIETIHRNSRATYGVPRVHAELRSIGIRCSRKRVAKLMRQANLRGCVRGRRMKATCRAALQQAAPDLVGRDFVSEETDRLWVADITYVRSQEGFIYLSFILDACSRKIVGWSMATHLRTELVVDALQMAIARRNPSPGLVHHSDRGVQGGFNRSSQHMLVVVSLAVLGRLRLASSSLKSFSVGSSESWRRRLALRARIVRGRCRVESTV